MSIVLDGTAGITSPGGDTATVSVATPILKSPSSLTLQTNGSTTALTIDTTQNVIVNGTTAVDRFTVGGSSHIGMYLGAGTTKKINFYNGTPTLISQIVYSDLDGSISIGSSTGNPYPTIMQASGVERARFNANGMGLGGAVPSSGYGITFPATQSASSNANTLDDYEEGGWTPNLSNNGFTGSWGALSGTYIKIGRVVTCWARFDGGSSGGSGSGALLVTGLPFPAESGTATWNNVGEYNSSGGSGSNQGSVIFSNAGGSVAQLWIGGAQDQSTKTFCSLMMTYLSTS